MLVIALVRDEAVESGFDVVGDGGVVTFAIDPFRRRCLLEGLDNIGLTLKSATAIGAYEEKARAERPWE